MAVVVDYEEADPDPASSFGDTPDLAAALSVQNDGLSWASNPYIEHGRGNAGTNCIGCHQHGGATVGIDYDGDGTLDPLDPDDLIDNERLFPSNGRIQVRSIFPSDYLWSTQRVDNLRQVIQSEVDHFDRVDADTPERRAQTVLALTAVAKDGVETFENNCTSCHGDDGTGSDIAPNLLNVVPTLSNVDLLLTLINGKDAMPSWAHFSDTELADLAAHLHTTYGALER
jgi:mono/diheme cytochrome c family protein